MSNRRYPKPNKTEQDRRTKQTDKLCSGPCRWWWPSTPWHRSPWPTSRLWSSGRQKATETTRFYRKPKVTLEKKENILKSVWFHFKHSLEEAEALKFIHGFLKRNTCTKHSNLSACWNLRSLGLNQPKWHIEILDPSHPHKILQGTCRNLCKPATQFLHLLISLPFLNCKPNKDAIN